MNIEISVVITTYKRPYIILERALKSVLNQSYSNIELIVVDDNPPDHICRIDIQESIQHIKDSRVRYIKHEINKGACEARNTGINLAKGKYVAFLDDDDEWLNQKLELQLEKFSNPKIGLVYCDAFMITIKDGNEIKRVTRANRISGEVFEKLISTNFIGSTSFVMVKKEALKKSGVFNNKIRSAQDYELWLRIARYFEVDYVNVPLVNYYIHEGDRISNNPDNKIQGLEMVNEINIAYLNKNPKLKSSRKMRILPYYTIKYGSKYGIIKWWESFLIFPFKKENFKYFLKVFYYSYQRKKYLKS